jgi:nicotinamide mononucleotide transporter
MSFFESFIQSLHSTTPIEFIAVVFGILSVWFSKRENILVYPVGLVNTIMYIFISIKGHLYGEATVNLYYTIVSIYGWILWAKRDKEQHHLVRISFSDKKEWLNQILFFGFFFIVIFSALSYLKEHFNPGVLPFPDAFASATAFTGMWLMAKKKMESWYWWIATNTASIPLYYLKGYAFTSVYYFILLLMAISGWIEWNNKMKVATANKTVQA